LPISTFTSEIVRVEKDSIQVKRLVEGGYELLDMKLPAVLTVVKEISNPRLPTLKGKLKAKEIKIPIWGPQIIDAQDDCLGLNGSPTRVVKIFTQKISREGEKLIVKDENGLNKAIDKIMNYLISKDLI